GAIIGGVTIQAGGKLQPGASPGTLDITGSLTLSATATARFELGGSQPGDGAGFYSQVNVTGNAFINNADLALAAVGGFDPGGAARGCDRESRAFADGVRSPRGAPLLTLRAAAQAGACGNWHARCGEKRRGNRARGCSQVRSPLLNPFAWPSWFRYIQGNLSR